MAEMQLCQALNLSNHQKCTGEANSPNGLFCRFHSHQAQGLYQGYKRRNARLDYLSENGPKLIIGLRGSLDAFAFTDVESEETLLEICNHLHQKHRLLSEVLQARRWHHDHFYPLQLDYGHEAYIHKLGSEKYSVLRALERAEARLADILYRQKKWFDWSRKCHEEDDLNQEKEKKKVTLENAMFKRQVKQMQARIDAVRAKEDERRRTAFLHKIYQERLLQEDEEQWDPITDEIYDKRPSYTDLIRYFLWMQPSLKEVIVSNTPQQDAPEDSIGNSIADAESSQANDTAKKKKKKKKGKPNTTADESNSQVTGDTVSKELEPDKTRIENESDMRKRLQERSEFNYSGVRGPVMFDTFENPKQFMEGNSPLPATHVDTLLQEIHEIKQYLFCRLLLAHPALLPLALRAKSVEEFLNDPDVPLTDLRDLCLKMERPGLQEIRDACADLHNRDEPRVDGDADTSLIVKPDVYGGTLFKSNTPKTWKPKNKKAADARDKAGLGFEDSDSTRAFVDFGAIDDQGIYTKEAMEIRLCGKTIWNYASQTAMPRSGWLHFSILAKNEDLNDAISLCRTWDEFFELSTLACLHYFPASNWQTWVGNSFNRQYMKLGLFVYFTNDMADVMSVRHQDGRRSGQQRRHFALEARPFLCAYMKRNDPVTRRFIQYVVLSSTTMNILVRDGKTGEFITEPEPQDRWLIRQKAGVGRAVKTDWKVIRQVDEKFFDEMNECRKWHFGFEDFYDVYIWGAAAGGSFMELTENVQRLVFKAKRLVTALDLYQPISYILKSLTRDEYERPRDIRSGEEVLSLWDELQSPKWKMAFGKVGMKGSSDDWGRADASNIPVEWVYTEADALEDAILFSEGANQEASSIPSLAVWENNGPSIKRFALDLESDEESDLEDSDDVLEPAETESFSQANPKTASEEGDWETELSDEEQDEYTEQELRLFNPTAQPEQVWSLSRSMKRKTWDVGLINIRRCLDPFVESPNRTPAFLKGDATYKWLKKWNREETRFMIDEIGLGEDGRMRRYYFDFIHRDKSHVFKKAFHAGDLEPGAQAKHAEIEAYLASMVENEMHSVDRAKAYVRVADLLGLSPSDHRYVLKEMARAYMMMCPSFPELEGYSIKQYIESPAGETFRVSKFWDIEQRAKELPNRRRLESNKFMPKEHWAAWETYRKSVTFVDGRIEASAEHAKRDRVIRPVLAQLYKAGIIKPFSSEHDRVSGLVAAIAEPGRDLDFYVDYDNNWARNFKLPSTMLDPSRYPDVLSTARDFAASNPSAHFALLRIWSAPHFYPLMMKVESRAEDSFQDLFTGRAWEWKFVCRDRVGSECSMHFTINNALEPHKPILKDHIIHRRDIILVMGKDEEDLALWTTAVTYVVQDKPWLREIDLWKSFINVELDFLQRLDKYWIN